MPNLKFDFKRIHLYLKTDFPMEPDSYNFCLYMCNYMPFII